MRRLVTALVLFASLEFVAQPANPTAPSTPKKPVETTYSGTQVVDDYQWLEHNDPQVQTWSQAQSDYARGVLDAISPGWRRQRRPGSRDASILMDVYVR